MAVGPVEYLAMGTVHAGGDDVLKPGEAEDIQDLLNENTSAWCKILNIGETWNHGEKFRETTINNSTSVPSLRIFVKDHKPVKERELP